MQKQQQNKKHQPEEGQRPLQLVPEEISLYTPLVSPAVTLELLAALLDFSPDALFIVDTSGMIVLLNTQMETLFGYGQEALLNQPIEILVPEGQRIAHQDWRLHYTKAPRARSMGSGLPLTGRRKDGSEFALDISLRPIEMLGVHYIMGAVRDMTMQRQGDLERLRLMEHLQQQNRLINLSNDAILVLDPTTRILSWNKGAEAVYGWTEQEAIGKRVSDLLSTRYPRSFEDLSQHLRRAGHWDGDLIQRCRNGREVVVESRWALVGNHAGIPNAILEINRDVTERRRLESLEKEARAETKARLDVIQLILDYLPTGVFLVRGPQERLLLANRAAMELWGAEWPYDQSIEEFLDQHHVRLFQTNGQPLQPEQSAIRRAMETGKTVLHQELTIRRPDGINLPVMVDALPLDLFHTCSRLPIEMAASLTPTERVILVVQQDVTALKETEALKDQFISLATHELRTPITVLAGYTDLLLRYTTQSKEPELDEDQKSKLQVMKEATSHLNKLTEDLLDVTRVQAGQFRLQRKRTDLIALARNVVEHLQTTTDQHQILLTTILKEFHASVDTMRIEQVLSNLLSNAIKYTPDGGPVEIKIWRDETQGEICFSVHDQGIGIPQEQKAHIFGRFMRAENARSAHIPGTGLGLYLCRELIERHAGRIWFESREGLGSTFFFTLPSETDVDYLEERL